MLMLLQDSEADTRMRDDEAEAEEKVAADAEEAMAKSAEAADRLKTELAANMKEKGDAFDSMIESEGKIRLGEDGWKARYYQVSTRTHATCTRVRLPHTGKRCVCSVSLFKI